jgi:hypothetical protein
MLCYPIPSAGCDILEMSQEVEEAIQGEGRNLFALKFFCVCGPESLPKVFRDAILLHARISKFLYSS